MHLLEPRRHVLVVDAPRPALPCRDTRGVASGNEEGSVIDETVRQHKFMLDESEMPTALVQHHARPADPAAAAAAPGHPAAGRARRPGAAVPDGPDPAGGDHGPVRRDPGEVLDVYRLWRPSPLFRAHRLEKALGTPARIYYKYEGVSPAGSHKPNTAVPQAYYNAKAGHPEARPPRPAPGSGARRWPSPARCSASSARSGRWARPTTRSPTAG